MNKEDTERIYRTLDEMLKRIWKLEIELIKLAEKVEHFDLKRNI